MLRFVVVTDGVDLDVSTQDLDGIAVDGILESGHHAVIEHHHPHRQSDRQDDDEGAGAVAPDVAPGQAKIEVHVRRSFVE